MWNSFQIESFRPEVREGATLSVINDNIYLFGGFSRKLFNEVIALKNISDGCDSSSIQWEIKEITNENLAPIPRPRFAHSASVFNSDIIIFGGSILYNKLTKSRQCYNDMFAFHCDTSRWEEIKCGGVALEPRRNHVSCIIGKNLLIHGGVDEHGNYLSDLMMTTLNKQKSEYQIAKWLPLPSKGEYIGPVALHTCCLVLANEKYHDPSLGLFFVPELKSTKIISKVCLEGIYFFGGRNKAGVVSNKMYVLKIGKARPEWIVPEISGTSPSARYGHTMDYYYGMKMIAIFGGRNENGSYAESSFNTNNISFLKVGESLAWNNVSISGSLPDPRYSHCSAFHGSRLIVFGGIADSSYCNSTLWILEFNPYEVNRLKESYEKQKLMHENKKNCIKIIKQPL